MSPMTRNRADLGSVPTAINAAYYAQRASAGLIITEATQVSPQGVGYPNTPGIHSAAQLEGWKQVTQAVHAKGGHISFSSGMSDAFRIRLCNWTVSCPWLLRRYGRKVKPGPPKE